MLEALFSFLIVGAVLAGTQRGLSQLVFGGPPKAGLRGWRGVWYVTGWAHCMLMGAGVGALATSLPAFGMGDGQAGRVFFYVCAGMFGTVCYNAVKGVVKQAAAAKVEANDA